jgi:ribosomal 50S subunit-associated protein YjgA (DUF615 family)
MKRARFTEEQIREILRAGEAAEDLPAFCDAQGITERNYRKWLASEVPEVAEPAQDPFASRSDRTREVKEINQLGLQLVALSQLKLDRIELPDELRSAIMQCRALTKGARVRQKRRVCKLLRDEDHAAIRKQVEFERARHVD